MSEGLAMIHDALDFMQGKRKPRTVDVIKEYGDDWSMYCAGCKELSKEHGEYFCIYDFICPLHNRNNEE